MCVKAIRIDENSSELCFRLLSLLVGEKAECKRIRYDELADQLNTSEENVRYNIRKLIKLGYIRSRGYLGYEPTEKVILHKD